MQVNPQRLSFIRGPLWYSACMKGEKHLPKELIPFKWKKGQSGNPNGRPPGKTLKEFAREYLMSLPDTEKVAYLASLPTDITWKMAEGNPANATDVTSGGDKLSINLVTFHGDPDTLPVDTGETPTSGSTK